MQRKSSTTKSKPSRNESVPEGTTWRQKSKPVLDPTIPLDLTLATILLHNDPTNPQFVLPPAYSPEKMTIAPNHEQATWSKTAPHAVPAVYQSIHIDGVVYKPNVVKLKRLPNSWFRVLSTDAHTSDIVKDGVFTGAEFHFGRVLVLRGRGWRVELGQHLDAEHK